MELKKHVAVAAAVLSCVCAPAARVYDVTDFGADGSDGQDDFPAFRAALKMAAATEGSIEVKVPSGTYHLSAPASIYSNTMLTLDPAARIVAMEGCGGLLRGQHTRPDGTDCPMDATCDHGGYTQLSNIVVQGGVWDCAGAADRVVYGIRLVHGRNIILRNLTSTGATDHNVNLSGCSCSIVSNVVFANSVRYTGNDAGFWYGTEVGNPLRYGGIEAVHLDFVEAAGEGETYPVDGTICRDVSVADCLFDGVFAGVGTHHLPSGDPISGVFVESSEFRNLYSYPLLAYGYTNCVFRDNVVTGGVGAAFVERSCLTFAENDISCPSGNALRVQGGGQVVSSGNTVRLPGANGFCVSDGSALASSGDEVISPAENGFYFSSSLGRVADAAVSSAGKNAVMAEDASNLGLTDCLLEASAVNGVTVLSASVLQATGIRVDGAETSGIVVSDSRCRLSGSSVEGVTVNGVQVFGGQCDVTECLISACGTSAFCAEGASDCFVAANAFSDCGTYGSIVRGGSSALLLDNAIAGTSGPGAFAAEGGTALVLRDNEFTGLGGDGVRAESGADVRAFGNLIEGPGGNGFYAMGGSRLGATGNEVRSVGGHGFIVQGCAQCEIAGNLVDGVTNAACNAVHLSSAPSARVVGNDISDAAGRGVYAIQCSGAFVSGNRVSNPGREGLYLDDPFDGVVCSNVVAEANGIGLRIGRTNGTNTTADVFLNDVSSLVANDIRVCASAVGCRLVGNACRKNGCVIEANALVGEFSPADVQASVTAVVTPVAGGASLHVAWEPLAGVDGYVVEWADNADFEGGALESLDAGADFYDFFPRNPDSDVYVRVRTQVIRDGGIYKSPGDPAFTVRYDWKGRYRVRFSSAGGSGEMPDAHPEVGAPFVFPECGFEPALGSAFAGWRLAASEGMPLLAPGDVVAEGLSAETNGAVEVEAHWTNAVYRLTLDDCGGQRRQMNVDATYMAALPALEPPHKDGFVFNGYWTGSNATGRCYYNAEGCGVRFWDFPNDGELYAAWKSADSALVEPAFTVVAPELVPDFDPRPDYDSDPDPVPGTDPDPVPGTNPDPVPGTDPDPVPGTNPDPVPGTDPDPVPGTDPDPVPGTNPDPVPGTNPDPVPGTDPDPADPAPGTDPEPADPEPETDPVVRPELFAEIEPITDPAAVFQAATIWDGWLEGDGEVLGTIQAKVAKLTARGAPKVTVSVVEGGRKIGGRGQMEIGADGSVSASCALKDGRTLHLAFGQDELYGTLPGAEIRGARTIFTSRRADDKQASEAVLARLQRTAVVYWNGNALSVVVANKGKCKVSGNLSSGARVSASSQLVAGEAWCAVPVAYAKRGADVRFVLWMNRLTGEVVVEGLGEGAKVQWATVPGETLRFRLEGEFDIPGATVLTQFLPSDEGLAFSGGKKWILPKGGAVKLDRASGEYVDTKPGTGNPSGLKLTYNQKTGAFKGSFKVHAVVNGKLKKYSASVVGIMVGDVGYGTATIKKFPGVEITVR